MKFKTRAPAWQVRKKAKRGFRGYPVATIAYYGPTADFASKVVVCVIAAEGGDPDPLKKWFTRGPDVRFDQTIVDEISEFIKANGVRSVAATDRLIGCPHEEEIDYPLGESCPQCPYWAGRDRFTHEIIE